MWFVVVKYYDEYVSHCSQHNLTTVFSNMDNNLLHYYHQGDNWTMNYIKNKNNLCCRVFSMLIVVITVHIFVKYWMLIFLIVIVVRMYIIQDHRNNTTLLITGWMQHWCTVNIIKSSTKRFHYGRTRE